MRLLRSEQGFTYVAAMIIVVIMGVMLAAAGQSWTTIMKREREEELIFRGTQIVRAIELWRPPLDPSKKNRMLNELKDLQKDPQSAGTQRYLRKIFTDPMTGKDFELIKDPTVGIKGVKSTSQDEPMKQGEFPVEWWEFEGRKKYSEWEFVFIPGNKDRKLSEHKKTGDVTGLGGSSGAGGSTGGPGGGSGSH